MEFSRHLNQWLSQNNCSIIFTSYKKGGVYCVSTDSKQEIKIYQSGWTRPMGAHVNKKTREILLSTSAYVVKFRNIDFPYDNNKYNFLTYLPTELKLVSDIDAHDISNDVRGLSNDVRGLSNDVRGLSNDVRNDDIFIASSMHNGIVKLCNDDDKKLYELVWTPKWLPPGKKLRADYCHVNGMCGKYVTCVSDTDTVGSWRENREDGGVIVDIETNRIVANGLSMPHSPRVNSNGDLYVLNSGRGEFLKINKESGEKEVVCFIPGYLRGLDFVDDKYAIIGSSMDRHEKCFAGLPLENILSEKRTSAKCGVYIVELASGSILHYAHFNQLIELYDVCHFPFKQNESGKILRLVDFNDQTLVTTNALR